MQPLRGFFGTMIEAAAVFLLALNSVSALSSSFSQAPAVAVASINLKGVVGYVRFETLNESSTRVVTNFTGLPTSTGLNWHVHRFPVDLTLDPAPRCLNNYVGGHYDPFAVRSNPNYATDCNPDNRTACEVGDLTGKFGQLQNGSSDNTDDTGLLDLGGRRGIVGRSIVIHDSTGANFVCATIRSIRELEGAAVVTLSSTFISPLAGTIYVRQVAGENAIMFGKLFWINLRGTTNNHNWHVHIQVPSANYRFGDCSDVEGHFDPFNRPPPNDPSYFCTPDKDNITNCEVGDLTGKHDQITVSGRPGPYQEAAFFFTDVFLNLTGVNAIEGCSIAIHAPNSTTPIIACAPLIRTEKRVASQFPSSYFQVSQPSPYDPTTITARTPSSSTINILEDVLTTYNLCPTGLPPYSPYSVSLSPRTPDEFPVGAVSRKYSSRLSATTPFSATELHVHGVPTVTSRTLRVVSGNNRMCSALIPPYNINTTVAAVATFNDSSINGHVIFFQEKYPDGSLGLTNMITSLYYTDSSMQMTTGHNWHIHQLPPVSGQPCQGTVGPHFNPFGVSLNNSNSISNYTEDCTSLTPLRCESGDLTGKHGQLSIAPSGPQQTTYSNIDPNLNLYGPANQTITGRSVGIHENIPGGPLFSCSQVSRAYLSPIFLTVVEPTSFNRVQFTENIASRAGVSSLSLLLMHVNLNGTSSCTEMALNTFEETASGAQRTANMVQASVCRQYSSDRCMMARSDYSTLCSGALATASVSIVMLIATVLLGLFL